MQVRTAFFCFVVITLIALDSVSAAEDNKLDKLKCESYIGEIPLDWREGYRGEVVEQSNGVYQAECRYPYNYVYGTPRDYASILVLWCEGEQCGDFTSYSREFGNPVESKKGKQALVVEKVTWTEHPQFINASQDFQEAKMKLLEQAEDRAISKDDFKDEFFDQCSDRAEPGALIGHVSGVSGDVKVISAGEEEWAWAPPYKGMPIFEGDRIETGSKRLDDMIHINLFNQDVREGPSCISKFQK